MVKRVPKGNKNGGQFTPDNSGIIPPTAVSEEHIPTRYQPTSQPSDKPSSELQNVYNLYTRTFVDENVSDTTHDFDGKTILPNTGLTLEEVRSKLSGLHFSQESLSDGERHILYMAEGLLRILDEEDERKYRY